MTPRILPSASSLPIVTLASPPAVPTIAAITSYVSSMMDLRSQAIATIEQNLSNAWTTLGQQIAQGVSSIQQQWNQMLGINPNPPNPSISAAVPQPGGDMGAGRGNASGSGSGGGAAATAHNSPNQALNKPTQQTGSGSGSGSGTTTNDPTSGPGAIKAHPLYGPGTGSGTFGVGSNGTGSVGSGTGSGHATVSGQVWLDNNGDGDDYGELGYDGIEVDLVEYSQSQPGQIVGRTATTTDPDGNYLFKNIVVGPEPKPYAIQVVFSSVPYVDIYATLRGPNTGPTH